MTHHIYRTEAIILTSQPVAEANRYYYILTKDLGVIAASAQGVSLAKSKLKFSLQPFSLSTISLVKGKYGWRIVNAQSQKSYYHLFKHNARHKGILARVLALVRRLVQGEESNSRLYQTVVDHFVFLEANAELTIEESQLIEYSLVLSILHFLGYMPVVPLIDGLIDEPLEKARLERMRPHRRVILEQINQALKETQL